MKSGLLIGVIATFSAVCASAQTSTSAQPYDWGQSAYRQMYQGRTSSDAYDWGQGAVNSQYGRPPPSSTSTASSSASTSTPAPASPSTGGGGGSGGAHASSGGGRGSPPSSGQGQGQGQGQLPSLTGPGIPSFAQSATGIGQSTITPLAPSTMGGVSH